MTRFIAQLLRFPLAVFVDSIEAFVNALRDIQKTTDQTIDAMVEGVTRALGNEHAGDRVAADSQLTGGINPEDNRQTTYKEDRKMSDQDLSGTGLKYVSYSILFTKPDLEATLEQQQEVLVNYSTNGESFSALRITEFFERNAEGQVRRPNVWRENNYPSNAVDDFHWRIPEDDRRYVTFIYQVDRRLEKGDPNYPKEQVRVLKQIRDRL
jgi:hypothetical protein